MAPAGFVPAAQRVFGRRGPACRVCSGAGLFCDGGRPACGRCRAGGRAPLCGYAGDAPDYEDVGRVGPHAGGRAEEPPGVPPDESPADTERRLLAGPATTILSDPEALPSVLPSSPFSPKPSALWIPLPVATRATLPHQEVVNIAVDCYFYTADLTIQMLHRVQFDRRSDKPLLLVCSMLLMAPYCDPALHIPGAEKGHDRDTWERALFRTARDELTALLARPGAAEYEAVAAVVNLYIWALFRGLSSLTAPLRKAAAYLAQLTGIVDSSGCAATPDFEDAATVLFGPDWREMELTVPEVRQLRDVFIRTHVPRRIAWTLLMAEASEKDVRRRLDPSTASGFPLIRLEGLRAPPMPGIWAASFEEDFDPRTVPSSPPVLDAVAWVRMPPGDPEREAAVACLSQDLISHRQLLDVLCDTLRAEVDVFLSLCLAAGLSSPAELPSKSPDLDPASPQPIQPTPLDPAIADLLARRARLDSALLAVRAAFPPGLCASFLAGRAGEAIAEVADASGSFHYGFNRVPTFWTLWLLRAELWSSLGLVTVPDGEGDRLAALADEFARPEEPLPSLLAELLAFPGLLADWWVPWRAAGRHVLTGRRSQAQVQSPPLLPHVQAPLHHLPRRLPPRRLPQAHRRRPLGPRRARAPGRRRRVVPRRPRELRRKRQLDAAAARGGGEDGGAGEGDAEGAGRGHAERGSGRRRGGGGGEGVRERAGGVPAVRGGACGVMVLELSVDIYVD
ncbi:hypothetical protein DFJ74DRAFT_76031 [Hyaloraphidium curvatum]|nr:hypothetical protein DFJ74DRAFT_76031 [Hyaloraphidium curvatum]